MGRKEAHIKCPTCGSSITVRATESMSAAEIKAADEAFRQMDVAFSYMDKAFAAIDRSFKHTCTIFRRGVR